MRQDPDVIMIGEIRDGETAESAIEVSLTGHKVFSTFHTDDTVGALIRLLDMGIEPYLVASTVTAVLSQRLVRVVCRYCREEERPNAMRLATFGLAPEQVASHLFFKGHGCAKCHQTGYKGRTAIHELLIVNDPIREAVLARKTASDIRAIAVKRARLISLREDGLYKALKGVTTLEEIERVIPQYMEEEIGRRSVAQLLELCGDGQAEVGQRNGAGGLPALEKTLPEPLFQVTIDCTDLKKSNKTVARLYEEYRRLARVAGRLEIEEFIQGLIRNVQGAVNGRACGFVPFSIRYKGGCERIFIELPGAEPVEVTPHPAVSAPA